MWTGVIPHASSNHFIQHFFDPMTAYTGRTKYILGEFGIGFTLVMAVMAAYFWMRRAEVAHPEIASFKNRTQPAPAQFLEYPVRDN